MQSWERFVSVSDLKHWWILANFQDRVSCVRIPSCGMRVSLEVRAPRPGALTSTEGLNLRQQLLAGIRPVGEYPKARGPNVNAKQRTPQKRPPICRDRCTYTHICICVYRGLNIIFNLILRYTRSI